MRFKSKSQGGFQIFAVTGVNTVSFGIKATAAARKGLLGFAVERVDPAEKESYFVQGMKVFPSVIPIPDVTTRVSTWDHPIQSFVWDDFTAKPGRTYTYRFFPLRGTPKNLDRSAPPVEIAITTEELFSKEVHDVFFNRGVASSQAYARTFNNKSPKDIKDKATQQKALDWLSRELDDGIIRFIKSAKKGDKLLGCFYEFHYLPVVQALAEAANELGVDVQLVIDAKDNSSYDKETGKPIAAFPRDANLRAIKASGISLSRVVQRTRRASNIQHNKFMVLIPKGKKPTQVWTGSTNLSDGGIHGQTNVGHWVRDTVTAEAFKDYWELLASDPGADDGRSPEGRKANAAFVAAVEALSPLPASVDEYPEGITPIFSPRKSITALEDYVALLAQAKSLACITLAFGINERFRNALAEHTDADALTFVLLEKRDVKKQPKAPLKPTAEQKEWKRLTAKNNVYQAWGSYLEAPVYQFARETNAGKLKLNKHVSYIHSKFMLVDPLGADPIVVTGSANFSDASTKSNDENMLVIRGDTRIADIYFTEFNRLFFHYYFRSVVEATEQMAKGSGRGLAPKAAPQFLKETAKEWLDDYEAGKLRAKRVEAFAAMAKATSGY